LSIRNTSHASELDRGNSVFDIRHRLSFNYVWDLPFLRKRYGLLHAMLGDWQVGGIWAFQTGAHWSPFRGGPAVLEELQDGACGPNADGFVNDPQNCINTGGDYNLNARIGDRPNAVASNVDATKQQWANGFNLADDFFSTPCLGCAGNLGRNTFVGPDYWNVDMSVSKTFALREPFRFQFRAEAFNVFNRTNFKLPTNNIRSPIFGRASGTFNPRQLQFGLRLSF